MDLFVPIVPEQLFHRSFSAVLAPFRKAERELLNNWAAGFPDRDGKLVREFQTTFNSTFWEIYLYACLKAYACDFDWSQASPDFCVRSRNVDLTIEATTANAAAGKPNEWARAFTEEELRTLRRFKQLNTEAIIRLSNAILGKLRKYETSYSNMGHVKGKPFVIAVAPFEQPHFNLQYDRPIRALLYDYYVDEDAYLNKPKAYPHGPPVVHLGTVDKENGAKIPLGIFNNKNYSEVSAVIFSCTATWGKLSAMSTNPLTNTIVASLWGTEPNGAPIRREVPRAQHHETILDGLQVYHNPFARTPLPHEIFRAPGVVQLFVDDKVSGEWVFENRGSALLYRQVRATPKRRADGIG
jgi:hypothetical protein